MYPDPCGIRYLRTFKSEEGVRGVVVLVEKKHFF